MMKLIPGKEYNLKNRHRVSYAHVVTYVMPQKLSQKDPEIFETFYYRNPREEELINRVITPQRGIIDVKEKTIICYNYFQSGSFLSEQEENPQEVREWLIMIQRIEEAYSSRIMCARAPFKKGFLFLN